jgi:hypothetical protein
MENTGSMSKDFEDFLYERLTGTRDESEGEIVPDILEELDPIFEKVFTDAGLSNKAQKKLDLDTVYLKILEGQEVVYSKGVKDGA